MLSITPQVVVFEMNTTLKVSMLSITPLVVVFEMNITLKVVLDKICIS
jgi:hypothetical protein